MKILLIFLMLINLIFCKDDVNPRGDYKKNFLLENIIQIPGINSIQIKSVEPRRINPAFSAKRVVTTTSSSKQVRDASVPPGFLEMEIGYPTSLVLIKATNLDKNKFANKVTFTNLPTVKSSPFSIPATILYVPQKEPSYFTTPYSSQTLTVAEFNNYSDLIEKYQPEEHILVRVPQGVETGLMKITKSGGVCDSMDGRNGINCDAIDMYVDCYAPFKNFFETENLIEMNKEFKQTFTTTETRAFRVDLEEGKNYINVSCRTIFTFKHFTRSCKAVEKIINDKNLIYAPTSIEIEREKDKPFTLQFQIAAGKGECSIIVLKDKLY